MIDQFPSIFIVFVKIDGNFMLTFNFMRTNLLSLLLGTSLFMISCNETKIIEHTVHSKKIVAKITNSVSSRTCIGTSDNESALVLWNAEDTIGVYGSTSQNVYYINQTDKVSQATFSGNMSDEPLYAYYPYSKQNSNVAYTAVTGEIPSIQTYDINNGKLQSDYKIGIPHPTEENVFMFKHLFSMLKFVINADNTDLSGDKLESITIRLPEERRLRGNFTVNLSDEGVTWISSESEKYNELTMKWQDSPELTDGSTYIGYITCAPEGVQENDEIQIIIQTEKHYATFTRTANMDFQANTIYTVPLTLESYTGTTANDLVVEERPTITSFAFEVANNEDKILGTELYYNGSSTTTRSVTSQSLDIDNEQKTIKGCIPYLYNFSLTPTFTTTENAIVTVNGIEQQSGVTEVDFSEPVEYTVSIGDNTQTYTVSVTNSGLPVVVLKSSGTGTESWSEAGLTVKAKTASFDEKNNPDYITVYEADGNVNLETAACGYRLRGNSTRNFPKKPFAIKLKSAANLLNIMPEGTHKRWVLLANWTERSLIRNAVAYEIANQTKAAWKNNTDKIGQGLIWNPSAKNVELVIDDRHIGNYLLGEQIKIDATSRVAIKEPYENGTATDVADYGYLLEFDSNRDDDEYGFNTNIRNIPCILKDAEASNNTIEDATIANYVKGRVNSVESYLSNGNYDEAYELLDINSVIDWWIVQELTMNNEYRQPKSAYMYIDGESKIYAGPVWDFDYQTFPNINNINAIHEEKRTAGYSAALEYHSTINDWLYRQTTTNYAKYGTYIWYPLLFGDDTFKNRIKERWSIIKPYLENIPAIIQDMGNKNMISEKYNFEIWPIESQQRINYSWFLRYSGDERLATYSDVIENLITYYTNRLNSMDALITNGNFVDNSNDSPLTPN